MAVTREACLANQVEKECGKGTLQPACLSLSYKTVKNNKDTVVFMKKCSELKYCQKLCNSGMIMDMENCKVRNWRASINSLAFLCQIQNLKTALAFSFDLFMPISFYGPEKCEIMM